MPVESSRRRLGAVLARAGDLGEATQPCRLVLARILTVAAKLSAVDHSPSILPEARSTKLDMQMVVMSGKPPYPLDFRIIEQDPLYQRIP
jgi:hypothetical protein